jgi:hypothetical protein
LQFAHPLIEIILSFGVQSPTALNLRSFFNSSAKFSLLGQGDGFIQKRLIFNNFYAFGPLSQESLRFYPAGALLRNQNYLSDGALESFNRLPFCQLLRQSQKRLVFDPLNFPAPSSHQSLSVNSPRLLDSDGLRLLYR